MKENRNQHYIMDAELVAFINGREDQVFTPAQLKDHLKYVCGATNTNNFVAKWLNVRLKKKEIKRLGAQGYYKRVRPLESKLEYLLRITGIKSNGSY